MLCQLRVWRVVLATERRSWRGVISNPQLNGDRRQTSGLASPHVLALKYGYGMPCAYGHLLVMQFLHVCTGRLTLGATG